MSASKGELTRERIVERAGLLASREGIEGLTLGVLAADLGMSKSGLFAHFRSKEHMQLVILEAWVARFQERVIRPALRARRGLPRLRQLFKLWLAWLAESDSPGGCLFVAAASELDDKTGPVRDYLVEQQKQLVDLLAGLAQAAVAMDELRADIDVRQLAFEIQGIIFATHHGLRLLREPKVVERARVAFERLYEDAIRPTQYQLLSREARKHDRSSLVEDVEATEERPSKAGGRGASSQRDSRARTYTGATANQSKRSKS
jgi:AcrR family transcriptional regulator